VVISRAHVNHPDFRYYIRTKKGSTVAHRRPKSQHEEATYTAAEFAAKYFLNPESLASNEGVIVLPNNLTFMDAPQHHLFSPFSKEILVTLNESGVEACSAPH
jgi:hypothetical protein